MQPILYSICNLGKHMYICQRFTWYNWLILYNHLDYQIPRHFWYFIFIVLKHSFWKLHILHFYNLTFISCVLLIIHLTLYCCTTFSCRLALFYATIYYIPHSDCTAGRINKLKCYKHQYLSGFFVYQQSKWCYWIYSVDTYHQLMPR